MFDLYRNVYYIQYNIIGLTLRITRRENDEVFIFIVIASHAHGKKNEAFAL